MWYNCREVFMDYRKEKDSFGEIEIESGALWGAQTERSRRNFRIGQQMPKELVYALANVKKAAAKANAQLGALDAQTERAIVAACELILSGDADDMFPLVVFQTGSGTQTNMNLNEVISRLCSQNGVQAHANDKVNMSQSTNDVFPTAIHVCCAELYPHAPSSRPQKPCSLIRRFKEKVRRYCQIGAHSLAGRHSRDFRQRAGRV